jgi:heat shock protein HtpX
VRAVSIVQAAPPQQFEKNCNMKNQLETILLLGALSALVVGVGHALAPGHGYAFAALALLMNLGAYFFRVAERIRRLENLEIHITSEAPGRRRVAA